MIYYNHNGATIYHGDCRTVLADLANSLPRERTALVTDPPYGIGEAKNDNASRTKNAVSKSYPIEKWDNETCEEGIAIARAVAKHQIIFGGNYYDLPPSPCWLVWDKDNGATDFADCEIAWTNLAKASRLKRYRWQGMLQEYGGARKETRYHRTQKPLDVMKWAIGHLPDEVEIILDPFAGSGTTLRAAKDLGKRSIGIEVNESYCEIAANRLRQEVLF